MGNDLDRRLLLGSAGLLGVAALAKLSHAGPIAPPVGVVSSTGKTLTEVEPRIAVNATNTPPGATSLYRISQSGSYYLTGNLAGVAGKHGIEIAASNVTLDLMGYEVRGNNAGTSQYSGILISDINGGFERVTVLNGTVNNWDSSAVNLAGVRHCTLHNLSVSGTQYAGIQCGDSSVITDCIASGNTIGYQPGLNAVMARCQARVCTSIGFWPGAGASLSQCVAYNCGGGFQVTNAVLVDCVADHTTTFGLGIWAQSRSTVLRCIATACGGPGITAADSLVAECLANNNTGHGIQISLGCQVRDNVCTSNAGYGIAVTGNRNRIEANQCLNNSRGIDCGASATGNLIVRNFVGNNASLGYNQGTGNLFGPNITTSGGMSSSNNPHSNYET